MDGGGGVGEFHKIYFGALVGCIYPCMAGDVGLECLLGGDVCGNGWDGGKFLGLVVFGADGVVEGCVDLGDEGGFVCWFEFDDGGAVS